MVDAPPFPSMDFGLNSARSRKICNLTLRSLCSGVSERREFTDGDAVVLLVLGVVRRGVGFWTGGGTVCSGCGLGFERQNRKSACDAEGSNQIRQAITLSLILIGVGWWWGRLVCTLGKILLERRGCSGGIQPAMFQGNGSEG